MIVHPDFLDHRKTIKLVELSGDKCAPFWVLRLWAYCQRQRKSVFDERDSVACGWLDQVCHAPISSDKLLAVLVESGFVRMDGNSLIVHDWEQVNRMLVSAWENGKKGGAPIRSDIRSAQTVNRSDNPPTRAGVREEDKIRAGYPVGSTDNNAAKDNPLGNSSFSSKAGKHGPTLKLRTNIPPSVQEAAYDRNKVSLPSDQDRAIVHKKIGAQMKKLAQSLRPNYSGEHGHAQDA